MATPNYDSLTLAAPRITYQKFYERLRDKGSPALPESKAVWDILLDQGVDPSFALAQYRVESQYGTSGFATVTGSWGNMLYDRGLTLLASGTYSRSVDGRLYVYATYANFSDAIIDYCRYVHDYAEDRGYETIYEATAEWIGRAPGSAGHISYVNIVIADMIEYEFEEGDFYEAGDEMIYAGQSIGVSNGRLNGQLKLRYPIRTGDTLYRGTDGVVLKQFSGTSGSAWFLGPVNGSWEWGAILVGTSSADPGGTVVYIKNPDESRVIRV